MVGPTFEEIAAVLYSDAPESFVASRKARAGRLIRSSPPGSSLSGSRRSRPGW
ncbi:hypothetical protein JM654_06605 [Microbacterium oxydans]|nr:hypothetical protein [Microbacterium oxydans]